MEKNIFNLDNEQLKEIARLFRERVIEGLIKRMRRYNVFPLLSHLMLPGLMGRHWFSTWVEPIIGWQ